MEESKPWFIKKEKGGYKTNTREGWAVVALYIFLMIMVVLYFKDYVNKEERVIDFIASLVLLSIGFRYVIYIKSKK